MDMAIKRPLTSTQQIFADVAMVPGVLPGSKKTLSKPSPRPAMLASMERSKTSLHIASKTSTSSLKEHESALSRQQLNKRISEFRNKI
jgi:hypothetical protein